MKQTADSVRQYSMDLFHRVTEADVMGLSAEMSYRFLFALFPFILFMVSLAGFFGTEETALTVVVWMQETMPPQAATILEQPVREVIASQRLDLLSIGAIAALWAASGVMGAIIKGMNRIHRVRDGRNFLMKNVMKVALTLFLVAVLLTAVAAVFFTQVLVAGLGALNLGPLAGMLATIAGPLAAFIILTLGVSVVYWKAPALGDHPYKLVTVGALVFAAGWVVATVIFSWYVARFGNYNEIYGSIGGIIILMLWAYMSSFLLLLGATVNALTEERVGALHPQERDVADEQRQAA
jgi:membrane protein